MYILLLSQVKMVLIMEMPEIGGKELPQSPNVIMLLDCVNMALIKIEMRQFVIFVGFQ